MGLRPDLPLVEVASREQWRAWLEVNHDVSRGVWAVTTKKAALQPGSAFVSARDLNEECLCFGWIDSKPGTVDASRTALLCTPRRPGSGWSKVNKTRLESLLASGQVASAGLAAIEAAKADGSWSALDAVDALEVPGDLSARFALYPGSSENFAAFPPSARRGILDWISQARTAPTRERRVDETARLAAVNVRANQWPRPPATGVADGP